MESAMRYFSLLMTCKDPALPTCPLVGLRISGSGGCMSHPNPGGTRREHIPRIFPESQRCVAETFCFETSPTVLAALAKSLDLLGFCVFARTRKSCGQALGEAWPHAIRSGTGRGGDVTGSRNSNF